MLRDAKRLLQISAAVLGQAYPLVAARWRSVASSSSSPATPFTAMSCRITQGLNMFHSIHHLLSRRTMLALGSSALLFSLPSHAAQAPINTLKNSVFGGRTDTAVNGYDTVAYFSVGKPVMGKDTFVLDWMGAKWKFASQANLELFKANPEKYAPQYGGYCAFGVAQGYLVKVDPDQFTVLDGKLYLNYDADVQAKWRKDPAGYIKIADAQFPALLQK
jgi:YHS domain-containing protein